MTGHANLSSPGTIATTTLKKLTTIGNLDSHTHRPCLGFALISWYSGENASEKD